MTHRGKTPFPSGAAIAAILPPPSQMAGQQACITLPRPVNSPVVLGFVRADKGHLGDLREAGVVWRNRRAGTGS